MECDFDSWHNMKLTMIYKGKGCDASSDTFQCTQYSTVYLRLDYKGLNSKIHITYLSPSDNKVNNCES